MKRKVKVSSIFDILMLISLGAFLFYCFWYQYAVGEIKGIMSFFGIEILLLDFYYLMRGRKIKYLAAIIGFLLIAAVSGYIFSPDNYLLSEMILRIIQYCIPMFGIYFYINGEKKKLEHIMICLAAAVSAMSIALLLSGTYNSMGALVLGDLNANVFSSVLLLGLISSFYLLDNGRAFYIRAILVILIILGLVSQVLAASRRGVVVYVFYIFTYIHSLLAIKYRKNALYKLMTLLLVITVLLIICLNINWQELTIISEFQRGVLGGDDLRHSYQAEAWNIFKDNPVFGGGLGVVWTRIGAYSHSFYFELLSCTGLVGTLVLLCTLGKWLLYFFKASEQYSSIDKAYALRTRTMAWGLVCVFVTGLAVVYIYDINFYVLLGIFAAFRQACDSQRVELGKEEISK